MTWALVILACWSDGRCETVELRDVGALTCIRPAAAAQAHVAATMPGARVMRASCAPGRPA